MTMPACLFPSADYEQSLRRRRLAGVGLMVLGVMGCLCYVLLLEEGSALSDYAQGFYLGFSCGLALAGVVVLVRAQYLLSHPQARRKARIRERDERSRAIAARSFQFAGLLTFYLCAAALLVAVAVNQIAAKVLLGVMAVYAAAFLCAGVVLSKRL